MKIGVISDTHGNNFDMQRAFDAVCRYVGSVSDIDAWIHCGDYAKDASLLASLTNKPIYAVRGNCDAYETNEPAERVVELDGVSIFITHGHTYGVNCSTNKLSYRAEELSCKVAIFGHTHIPCLEMNGPVMILNPGSPTRPLSHVGATSAILTLTNSIPNAHIIIL